MMLIRMILICLVVGLDFVGLVVVGLDVDDTYDIDTCNVYMYYNVDTYDIITYNCSYV